MSVPKFNMSDIAEFTVLADTFLADLNLTRSQIVTGFDAWTVAARAGISKRCFEDRSTTDAHIQTALQSVFPNAVFKERKRY